MPQQFMMRGDRLLLALDFCAALRWSSDVPADVKEFDRKCCSEIRDAAIRPWASDMFSCLIGVEPYCERQDALRTLLRANFSALQATDLWMDPLLPWLFLGDDPHADQWRVLKALIGRFASGEITADMLKKSETVATP